MSSHNIDFQSWKAPASIAIFNTPAGYLLGWGTTVGNGNEGWAPGAEYFKHDGSGQTTKYINRGTKTTASFQPESNAVSAQGVMPLSLVAFTKEDGTIMTKQATTVVGFAQLANKEVVINIPVDAAAGNESVQATIPVPQDLDDSKDIVVHVLVGKAADSDVLTLDCEVYPCAVGDTANADIQDTAAQTVTQAALELSFTCGTDGVLAAPGTLTIILTLGGTNDADAMYIYGAWIEYTSKTLAS